jgi:hypothetical protein
MPMRDVGLTGGLAGGWDRQGGRVAVACIDSNRWVGPRITEHCTGNSTVLHFVSPSNCAICPPRRPPDEKSSAGTSFNSKSCQPRQPLEPICSQINARFRAFFARFLGSNSRRDGPHFLTAIRLRLPYHPRQPPSRGITPIESIAQTLPARRLHAPTCLAFCPSGVPPAALVFGSQFFGASEAHILVHRATRPNTPRLRPLDRSTC